MFRPLVVNLLLGLCGICLHAQTVEIYSEFQRVDPFGEVVPQDLAARPREILSPAVVRNSWASFQVVISAPPNTTYLLYVATNPLNACRVEMYKEHFGRTTAGWVPDKLSKLEQLPDFGFVSDPADGIPGQSTRIYLLDVWIPPETEGARFRLEVQLKVGSWVVTPMEVRVLPVRVPELKITTQTASLPPVEAGADSAAIGPLLNFIDGRRDLTYSVPATLRGIIRRNAIQDMALAGTLGAAESLRIRERWEKLLWSGTLLLPRLLGAEWYLRLRDSIYRVAEEQTRN